MGNASHYLITKATALFLVISSLLGWNITATTTPPVVAPVIVVATTTPKKIVTRTDKEATSTKSVTAPLPYLRIIAPDFAQLPLRRNPNPQQTVTTPNLPEIPGPSVTTQPTSTSTQASSTPSIQAPNDTLVNIFCTFQKGNTLSYITGSGVIIDSKGVIITNSHVAQYVLLSDHINDSMHSCIGRTGSPAQNAYTLKVLYVSSAWINSNSQDISAINPTGTGQSDYALLVITGSASKSPVPNYFSYLPFSKQNLSTGDQVTVSGYPAGTLDAVSVKANLPRQTASTFIANTYSFDGGSNPDLIVTGNNQIAQKGSSGGAVIGSDNTLRAIITTSIADASGARSLSAITTTYINKDLQAHIGEGVDSLINGDIKNAATIYEQTIGASLAETLLSANPN